VAQAFLAARRVVVLAGAALAVLARLADAALVAVVFLAGVALVV
jgi:hypothetical protein